jgi:hypothetical protein
MATKTKKLLSKGSGKKGEKKIFTPTLSLKTLSFMSVLNYVKHHFARLNNSKYFIGLVLLIMNIGSR